MLHYCRFLLHLCSCSLGISSFMHHLITSPELIVLHWEIQQSYQINGQTKKWLHSAWSVLIIHESDFGLLFRACMKVIQSTSKVNGPPYLARMSKTEKCHESWSKLQVLTWGYLQQCFPLLAGSNNSTTFGNLNLPFNAFHWSRTEPPVTTLRLTRQLSQKRAATTLEQN